MKNNKAAKRTKVNMVQVRDLYDDGNGIEEIAEDLNMSVSEVSDCLIATAGMPWFGRKES